MIIIRETEIQVDWSQTEILQGNNKCKITIILGQHLVLPMDYYILEGILGDKTPLYLIKGFWVHLA